jgi:hypothetical protein
MNTFLFFVPEGQDLFKRRSGFQGLKEIIVLEGSAGKAFSAGYSLQ